MQKDSRFFDDLAKVAGGAAGQLIEIKREIDAHIAVQVEKWLQRAHLATKEEYETLLAMLSKLRTEQEEIKKRLDALEGASPKKTGKK